MTTSGDKVQNDFNPEKLREALLQIGARELEFWKYQVLTEEEVFNKLLRLTFQEEERVSWRSAWIIDHAAEEYPELLDIHIPEIIRHFLITKNGSLKRIYTRILTRYTIPEEFKGILVDHCYQLLSPFESVGVRVFAMQLLFNISGEEPDLKPELALVISGILEEEGGTAGLRNKAEKLLKKLSTNALKRRIKPLK